VKVIPDSGAVKTHYDPQGDVLEIELDAGLKRTATLAYEDLVLLHLGTRPDRPSELFFQGMTLIGYQRIRERLHGDDAGAPQQTAAEAEEFLRGIEVELQDGGSVVLIKDARYWDTAGARLRMRLGRHVEMVHDLRGEPIGFVFSNVNGIDEAALGELFDFLFSTIFPSEEDQREPVRLASSRAAVDRWFKPLFARAA